MSEGGSKGGRKCVSDLHRSGAVEIEQQQRDRGIPSAEALGASGARLSQRLLAAEEQAAKRMGSNLARRSPGAGSHHGGATIGVAMRVHGRHAQAVEHLLKVALEGLKDRLVHPLVRVSSFLFQSRSTARGRACNAETALKRPTIESERSD